MTSFLNIVAKDLLLKHGEDLSSITIVFPNKRASLFFNAELASLCDKPIWSPNYTTISELFSSQTSLLLADRIQLICELHKSYTKITGSTETLEQFYNWGELMLADFDDVDKHLAQADKVFMLLSNIHELDSVEYLTPEKQEAIRRFFSNFSLDHNSELKKRFLQLWNKIEEIYNDYRDRLFSQGIAYEGMLYRFVIENVLPGLESSLAHDSSHSDDRSQTDNRSRSTLFAESQYVFIGFNLLNTVEERLFTYLKKNHNARFYWDFDHHYMQKSDGSDASGANSSDNRYTPDAGKYISQYLGCFPNELSLDNPVYKQFSNKQDVAIVSATTEDIQARYISQWLTPERIAAGRKTAIVMADESLLETVLHCLPPEVRHVNITCGYPLEKSPVASLVRLVMALYQRKVNTLHSINGILQHPYAKYISSNFEELFDNLNGSKIFYPTNEDLAIDEAFAQFFTPLTNTNNGVEINERLIWITKHIARNTNPEDNFTNEALYRLYTILNRLSAQSLEDMPLTLYGKLLNQIIKSTTIPFHGEPIDGIQIMGILETRSLDFDNILLLSCNEGNMPAKLNDSSFIPHSIRKGYSLTTIDNKVAIYSYYFHRLIQRASTLHITYNNSTNDGHTGEMSRFILQLMADNPFPMRRLALSAGQTTLSHSIEQIAKDDAMVSMLIDRKYFSPSALGRYLRCQLSFYYKYIMGINDFLDGDEEEMDNQSFGSIFHSAAEKIYKSCIGRTVTREYIERLLDEKGNVTIHRFVDEAFREQLFNLKDSNRPMPRLGGLQVINAEMIFSFIVKLLRYDLQLTPFKVLGLEEKVYDNIPVSTIHGTTDISIGGAIDRLDMVTDKTLGTQTIRIIDYKTGRYNTLDIPSVEDIFNPEYIKKHSDYYLQAMMYSSIVAKHQKAPIMPALLYIQQLDKEGYQPTLKINKQEILNAEEYFSAYRESLVRLIEDILNPELPFHKCSDDSHCAHCPYSKFCR